MKLIYGAVAQSKSIDFEETFSSRIVHGLPKKILNSICYNSDVANPIAGSLNHKTNIK